MALTELISFWIMRQGTVQGTKSTVITPLIWAVGIQTTGLVVGSASGLPTGVIVVLCVCVVLTLLALLGAFAYFAWKNPDLLRTEQYTLTKLAIEHRLSGDDKAGIREAVEMIGSEPSGMKVALPTPDSKPSKAKAKKPAKAVEKQSEETGS